jgi:hypothetical protein
MIEYGFIVVGFVKGLICELDTKFPTHAIMDVLGIVYSQYWLQPNVNVSFRNIWRFLKLHFIVARLPPWMDKRYQVLELFNAGDL